MRVGSEEIEPNYRNNVAAALARVIGPVTPPAGLKLCRTLTAEPRSLQGGRTAIVRVTARNPLGKPLARVPVRARGAGVRERTTTGADGVARFAMTPRQLGIVYFEESGRTVASRGSQCRTLLGVQKTLGGSVTG